MCGIGAIYSPNRGVSPNLLGAMQSVVRHRGPDDEGTVCFYSVNGPAVIAGGRDTPESAYAAPLPYAPQCHGIEKNGAILALAHRRLSILDPSASGHQPMCTSDRGCWIVYNGEIYNYLELREELEALGQVFISRSDTEVILAAYQTWGRDCLSRFNGMFAIVLFDRVRRKLFVVRDRFGVKPLYYWVSPEKFIAFASEIKQFSALPGWRPRINGQRAYDFLQWGLTDQTDETLFDGVFQLRGVEAVELYFDNSWARSVVHGNRLPVYRWYQLKGNDTCVLPLSDAGHEFRRLLTDSVRLRLRSDVPVGSCLSGGLDSSSIVCLMNGLLREQEADT